MRVLILALALAACAPSPQTEDAPAPAPEAQDATPQAANLARVPNWTVARSQGVDFRGVGQEPGWIIDIYQQNRIVLLLDYGETLLEFPLPTPAYPQEGATVYETSANNRTLRVTVRRAPCEDAMSGEPFPSTVEVRIDDRTLTGCGRSV